MESALKIAMQYHWTVGDIRGRGFFVGIELVADRNTKQPFDPELTMFDRIRRRAMEAGLICYPVGGTLDGNQGDVAILAPPYIATNNELEEIIDKFDGALRSVLDDVRKTSQKTRERSRYGQSNRYSNDTCKFIVDRLRAVAYTR